LLCGDKDALPMSKETGLDFASKVDGRMYSCGHDAHTAMLATAAHLLCSHRARLKGNVKFMFQPGGEGYKGAKGYPPTINDGAFVDLEETAVSRNFGQGAFARDAHPRMGSEDFSYILQHYPGAFAFLGAAPKEVNSVEAAGNHSPYMEIDEDTMTNGAAAMPPSPLNF